MKGIKRKYKQNIQNAAFYHPLEMLLTSFSKHSVLIPRGQSVSALTGGVEYFRKDRQHMWHNLVPREIVCCLSSQKYSTPPVTTDTLCPRGISTECFEKLVSSISKGGKMLHFVYFVYIFF